MVNWLFVDLNSYFASCEQQLHPRLRGKPVGVVPMLADSTCCIAASVEAKRFGVKTGTSVRDAKRMCPDITFMVADHSHYVRFHHEIVTAVESCLPVHAVLSVDEMICRLTGSQEQLPVAIELARKVKATILKNVGECLKSSVGLATNQWLAKIGSDMQKPDGLVTILKEDLPHKLFQLKLRDLPGIGVQMERRLNMRGVCSVEALCSASIGEMRSFWGGIWGERVYWWLRGKDVYIPPSKPSCLGHQHVLAPEYRSLPRAYIVLQKLLVKAAIRLRKEGFYARRLTVAVKFIGAEAGYFDRSCRLEETQDTRLMLDSLAIIWSQVSAVNAKPLRVGVVLSDLVPETEHQFSLFGNPKQEVLSHVLDSINERFGRDTVQFASLHGSETVAQPKVAFQRVPEIDEF